MSGWLYEKTLAKRLDGFINLELGCGLSTDEIIAALQRAAKSMRKQFKPKKKRSKQ